MPVLVTGAAGYIGSVVTHMLVLRGYAVTAFDSLSQGHRAAVDPNARFVAEDLGDNRALENIFKSNPVDAVVHLAAETVVEKSMSDPRAYFQNNVRNGLNLLDMMVAHGVKKMIFSSTAAVYGEPRSIPIREEDALDPVNAYGESKLMFERILAWYHRAYGVQYATFRYFNAAGGLDGIGEHHEPESHLIPLVLQVALGLRSFVGIFGSDYPTPDGTCLRDYVHVADIAQAHILALENLDRIGARVFNIGNGDGYSVKQVIEAARKITGHPIPATESPRRVGDPARLVASSDRIRNELNWTPRYPEIDSIIESAWQWHCKHPHGYDEQGWSGN